MAYLVKINYIHHVTQNGAYQEATNTLKNVPVLYRADGSMWEEACAYLTNRAHEVISGLLKIKTVQSIAWHLHAYLQYCESNDLHPMHFGRGRGDKPTYLFRSYLVRQKNRKEKRKLESSTASTRINAVTGFFSWALQHGFLDTLAEPFQVKSISRLKYDKQGFARKVCVNSTDLAIRKSRTERVTVEGGLLPVSLKVRDQILNAAHNYSSCEFALMLDLGFRTGLRLQSICGLTVTSIKSARASEVSGIYYLNVGPKHGVPTKFDVNYTSQIPGDLLERLSEYVYSSRRIGRTALALPEDANLVFLNRWGKPYNDSGSDHSCSVSQDLHRLREKLTGQLDLSEFYFHCTRATFGTSIVLAGLRVGLKIDQIINRVRELLGHKDAATSLEYIAFVEEIQTNDAIDREISGT